MKQKLLSLIFVLTCLVGVSVAQNRQVSGKVTSANDGSPVSGVSVAIVGTSTATQTDGSGNYSLSVPANSTLSFSYIGYVSQRVPVGNQTILNVQLATDETSLEEVVVTALGITKDKKSIGYSTSNVSGDDLRKSGEANVIQGLAAKASGVQVTSSSGTPGASSKIILRGPASFSGDNQPLIVVDGVPLDNDVNIVTAGDDPYNYALAGVQTGNRALDLNPDDIETVTILKGPAAAALYGQAAGNGAIIYTTKKGKLQSGIGIVYTSSADFQTVNKLPKTQKRYGQGLDGEYTATTPNSWGEDLIAAGKPIYNNVEDFFQTGTLFNNNVAITSGGEKTTFRLSLGSTNNKGIVPHSSFNRYTARLTSESKLTDYLTVGGTLNYINSNSRAVQNGSNLAGVMLALTRTPRGFNLADYVNEDGTQKQYFGSYDNPYWSTENNPFTDEVNRVNGNLYTDIKLSNVFSVTWKTGLDAYNTAGNQVYAIGSIGDDNSTGLGEVKRTSVNFRNLYTDLLLKFNTALGDDFSVSGLLGGNFNYTQYNSLFGRGRELSMPNYYNFQSAKDLYVSNYESYRNNKAIFLDATFDYRSLLFLTLTGRNEWSTTFGKDAKGFFYPKADLSYIFSHLLSDNSVLNYGKVRVAYSNVGISPSVYSNRAYYSAPLIADGMTNGFSFPYLGQTGFAISSEAVSNELKPERNAGYEVGLELQFFKNRLALDATYYNQYSTDLLISQPIDPTTGFQYFYNNVGKINNKGLELGLTGHIIKSDDFNWNARVNWSKNENTVEKLAPGVEALSIGAAFAAPQSYAIVGEPFGVMYSLKIRRDEAGNMLINPANGLPLYEDDLGSVGSTIPDWLMNINNEFSYRNLSFSFLWDFRKGGKLWSGTYTNLINRGVADITEDRERTYLIDGVYASGPQAGEKNTTEVSAFNYFSSYLGNTNSEMAIEDGSWVRLRSVDINYRINKLGSLSNAVQYIQVGLNLRNPLLFTKYKGVDPETSLTGSSQNFAGYDYYNNPGTKSFSVNLRVGF